MTDLDSRYGDEDVQLSCLTDRSGLLRNAERDRVKAAMSCFNKRFPQFFLAIHTSSLGEISQLRQFGFWLLNHAAFEDVSIEQPNEAGILLTLDPESRAAGVVFGYKLDPFLDEEDTFECLSRAHAYWLEGRYADGMIKFTQHLESVLKKRCEHARRDPEYFLRKLMPAGKMGDIVKRIREGHQPSTKLLEKIEK